MNALISDENETLDDEEIRESHLEGRADFLSEEFSCRC